MKQVKLIIASTFKDTVYFNYGDDYSDITRVLVEDHSPWEEVDNDEFYTLEEFVRNYNNKRGNTSFAFLIEKPKQISAQSAIEQILKKKKEQAERDRKEMERIEKERERKKQEREMKKLAKTKEDKRKLLEKLKEELGES